MTTVVSGMIPLPEAVLALLIYRFFAANILGEVFLMKLMVLSCCFLIEGFDFCLDFSAGDGDVFSGLIALSGDSTDVFFFIY